VSLSVRIVSGELERTWKEAVMMFFEVLSQKLPENEQELPF